VFAKRRVRHINFHRHENALRTRAIRIHVPLLDRARCGVQLCPVRRNASLRLIMSRLFRRRFQMSQVICHATVRRSSHVRGNFHRASRSRCPRCSDLYVTSSYPLLLFPRGNYCILKMTTFKLRLKLCQTARTCARHRYRRERIVVRERVPAERNCAKNY